MEVRRLPVTLSAKGGRTIAKQCICAPFGSWRLAFVVSTELLAAMNYRGKLHLVRNLSKKSLGLVYRFARLAGTSH
jgi:hypothetical protein